ncbi:hypothetical protein C2G38_304894 [Gigaspora rosea]|uniref:Uncharacterized protein n=1 Tax=Gigaspora rosea TaxID=44941 RepID=A0A397VWM8_9GLOM|nr:hypothetical protein C2G38_304894 [Gigaspora rosea]
MELKFFETLSNNYLELLDDKEEFNIVINVGESPKAKNISSTFSNFKIQIFIFSGKDENNTKHLI